MMCERNSGRGGFTLVELLVVIGIIAVLVGLLIPAVQAAREASRRTSCMNNIKQVGLAWQQYEQIRKTFPEGGEFGLNSNCPSYRNGAPLVGTAQNASWAFRILPYLEQDLIYSGQGGLTDFENARRASAAKISGYFCPSRRGPSSLVDGIGLTRGLLDYAANGGTALAIAIASDSPTTMYLAQETVGVCRRNADGGGIRTVQIVDGLAHTMLAGDKALDVVSYGTWGHDDNEGYGVGWDQDGIRWGNIQPRRDVFTGERWGRKRFGSAHPNGVSVVLADGSVRMVSYNVDLTAFASTCSINDGKIVRLD